MRKQETIQESTDRVMAAACRYRDAVEAVRVNRARVESLEIAIDECQRKLRTWELELDEARKELHRAALRE